MKKISGPLARRYGTALYECALEASKKDGTDLFEQFIKCARVLLATFDKKINSFFINPTLSIQEKNNLLEEVLNKVFSNDLTLPREFNDFLKLMLENDRFSELSSVLKNFLAKADDHIGVARATIVSASKLTNAGTDEFTSALSSVLNKKIILETEVDENLRSGFIIKIGNTNVDASLRSRLLNLKESLS